MWSFNDIVVFNYPAGDTLVSNEQYQAADYYQMCYSFGSQAAQLPARDGQADTTGAV